MKAIRSALLALAWLFVALPAAAAGLNLPLTGAGGNGAAAPPPVLIASVNATFPASAITTTGCWSAQWPTDNPTIPNPDGGSPLQQAGVRAGYTTSGGVTSYAYNWTFTARVRQVFPNQATPTARTVALSEDVYPTDTIGTVDTSGCDRAPTPVLNWATPHRQVIGNSLSGVEILAFSRDAQAGKQIPAVTCAATDGVLTSPTVTVSAMTISSRPDVNPVIDYAVPAIDTSALASGLITLNCKGYPWYGGPASIADSSALSATAANLRLFSARYFWKDTGPLIGAFLCPIGGGSCTGSPTTSCVASTNLATAAATPCSTGKAAVDALKAAGAVDNAAVFVGANSGTLPIVDYLTSGSLIQHGGCLTYTRDPLVTRANAQLGFGGGQAPGIFTVTNPTSTACIRFTDLSMVRNGGFAIDNVIATELIWDQINLDDGSFTGSWLKNAGVDYLYDVAISNPGANFLASALASVGHHAIERGINVTDGGNFEVTTLVGTTLTSSTGLATPNGATDDGSIVAFSKFLKIVSGGFAGIATDTPNGAAYVQNVFEDISATGSNTLFTFSNDSNTNSTNNVIIQYNTVLGAYIAGRSNTFYDDGATERVNKLQSCRGNLLGQLNTKGDVFETDGTRVGNWSFLYGTGCSGQFTQYIDANGGGLGTSFAQAYPGLGSLIGTSDKAAQMPVTKFTSYQGVTCVVPGTSCATFVPGAGIGDYRLTTGALVKSLVPTAALPFDLAGTARPTTADTAGAYVAPIQMDTGGEGRADNDNDLFAKVA